MDRRLLTMSLFLAALAGCVSSDYQPETGGVRPRYGKGAPPPYVPGVEGPYGTKVPMAAPYAYAPPPNEMVAREMMSKNLPLSAVQMNPTGGMPMPGPGGSMMPNPMAPGGMLLSPPGVPGLPGMSPPGGMPMPPGGMPPFGPGGPTPPGGMPPMVPGMPPMGSNPLQRTSFTNAPDSGLMTADLRGAANSKVTPAQFTPNGGGNGVTPAQFSNSNPVGSMFPAQRTQVYFGTPVRMKVYWFTQGPDGKPNFSTTALETPGRYNFAQGAIYRLKLTNIPGRPALELYPTLEVVPTSPRTNEFLAHNSVPIDFSEEDFKQVVDRNYIVKVIYLPDPANQDGAGAGPGEISSTQLQPGQDPIQEALRRGSILLVLRIGNIDQGVQHTPSMTAPVPSGPPLPTKPVNQGVMPGVQVPYNLPPITPGTVMPPPGFAPNQLPPLNLAPNDEKVNAPKNGKIDLPKEPKKGADNKLDLPPLPPPGLKANDPNLPLPGLPLPPPGLNPKVENKAPVVQPKEEIKVPAPTVNPEATKSIDDIKLPPPPSAKQNVDQPLPLPNAEKPVAPLPNTDKPLPLPTGNNAPKSPPVIPASKNAQTNPPVPPVVLPEIPGMVDPLSPAQPPLPMIPMPTDKK